MFYLLTPDEMRKNFYGLKQVEDIIDRSSLDKNRVLNDQEYKDKDYQEHRDFRDSNIEEENIYNIHNTHNTHNIDNTDNIYTPQQKKKTHQSRSYRAPNQPNQSYSNMRKYHMASREKNTHKTHNIHNIPKRSKTSKNFRVNSLSKKEYKRLMDNEAQKQSSIYKKIMQRSSSMNFRGGKYIFYYLRAPQKLPNKST